MSTVLTQLSLVALFAAALSPVFLNQQASADEPKGERVFEQRIYYTHPGKMPDLHKRFREHTNRLFVKHGMDLIGYWTPVSGDDAENTLVYILAYPSREAREKSWKAFLDDPDWKTAYAASHQDGPIVKKVESMFLAPTDYSPVK